MAAVSTVVQSAGTDLAAWIGVAGVAVGVVMTTTVEWLRDRCTTRRQQRREVLAAAVQLTGAASTMASLLLSSESAGADSIRATAVQWTLAMASQLERANDAAVTIIRLAPPAVADAATTIRGIAERIDNADLKWFTARDEIKEASTVLYDALAKTGFLPARPLLGPEDGRC